MATPPFTQCDIINCTSCFYPPGVLLVSTTEEVQPMRRRSFDLHIKQEEGGASGPEDRNIKFIPSPNWFRERPETDLSHLSNQIQSYRDEAGPQPTEDHPVAFTVKPEVDEGHVTLEEFNSQQEGW